MKLTIQIVLVGGEVLAIFTSCGTKMFLAKAFESIKINIKNYIILLCYVENVNCFGVIVEKKTDSSL